MGGGLMQLVAYGAQDIYLTGNPQITFFKVVYRRHTNFSMETIEQTITGSLDFGNQVTATISRNGDLVTNMYIKYSPRDLSTRVSDRYPKDLGITSVYDYYHPQGAQISFIDLSHIFPRLSAGLLKEVSIEIGGQEIDRHYAHWYSVREDLFEKNELGTIKRDDPAFPQEAQYQGSIVPNITPSGDEYSQTRYQKLTAETIALDSTTLNTVESAHIPLHFWFCRNPGLALPLIALQYHEVKINITISNKEDLSKKFVNIWAGGTVEFGINNSNFNNFKLFADYIYLDTDERRRFAQVSHEYLIEQLQYEEFASEKTLELNFNHPVKELIWCAVPLINTHSTPFETLGINSFNDLHTLVSNHQTLDDELPELPLSNFVNQRGDYLFSQLTTQTKLSGGIGGNELSDHGLFSGVGMGVPGVQTGASSLDGGFYLNQGPSDPSHPDSIGTFPNLASGQYQNVVTMPPPKRLGNNFTSSAKDFNITLKLNGNERFTPQGITYFSRKQIYDHHTGPGSVFDQDAICVYSFALKPEEHQPSGTCNFSRIDKAELVFSKKPSLLCQKYGFSKMEQNPDFDTIQGLIDAAGGNAFSAGFTIANFHRQFITNYQMKYEDIDIKTIRVYAINYNVLRIMSGMGGLAYSN